MSFLRVPFNPAGGAGAVSDAAQRAGVSNEPADWIVGIARSQDRGCFISLFTLFAPKVKSYLLRQGVAEPSAEELAQETLLAVWRKANQFDSERATAGAWIYTIARNLRVDLLRHERHPDDGRIAEPVDEQPTPEQTLKASEGEKRVRAAIDSLPPEQAQVLRLSFFDDLSHPEIAIRLGLPLGTVKSRIRLATAHLRLVLEGLV